MPSSIVHLPNGQTLTVTPVFGGLFFKSNNLSPHHNVFPPGWTIILNSEDDEDDHGPQSSSSTTPNASTSTPSDTSTGLWQQKKHHIHRFRQPSLHSDHLFISSISNPSSQDFKPATSQTRSIAMMLWATLWWYFHQPPPPPYLTNSLTSQIPEEGRPHGEWRVNINREGIFTGKHLLPKLERMGLIASEDSSVGLDPDDGVSRSGEGWTKMFVSQRTFWQLDPRIYLFTLTPAHVASPFPTASPSDSRAASPDRRPGLASRTATDESTSSQQGILTPMSIATATPPHLSRHNTPPGPFTSNSHLPTYYPAPPAQYVFTNGIRHPIRPKPPRQGEMFYTRYIPSLGQYLSFRIASLSTKPCTYVGPTTTSQSDLASSALAAAPLAGPTSHPSSTSTPSSPAPPDPPPSSSPSSPSPSCENLSDAEILQKWMNNPRVASAWAATGDVASQRQFLGTNLTRKNSFPVIGSFDGKPFGYFEIYWVREDAVGGFLGGGGGSAPGDYDRGIHVLVGEEGFRGPQRVRVWLSALVHYCWLADSRTEVVMLEPRVDNLKMLDYCQQVGFYKEREIAFPHKQANLLKIRRDAWQAPAI